VKTLDQFITWLARIAGDAAMTMQARGGVYLAGGIAPSIVEKLKTGSVPYYLPGEGPSCSRHAADPGLCDRRQVPGLQGLCRSHC
jgi:glucokinase